jgi:fused signal recognition particle receptor
MVGQPLAPDKFHCEKRRSVSDTEQLDAGKGFWKRLKSGLGKTRNQLTEGVGNLLLGEKEIDDDVLADLETALLLTDVGVDATREIMDKLTRRVNRKELNDTRALHEALANLLKEMLVPLKKELVILPDKRPFVIFFVGVNGVGKTTTIGKLARHFQQQGLTLLLAAGDTFRAAAVEQLKAWGERNDVSVVAQQQGADSASVVFDAVQAAQSRAADVVLVDTAGRLQAKTNLMEELAKIRRVVTRLDAQAPHEVLLVLDAGVGQNALSQVREFDAAVGVTGLVITKLDGTAKAGVLFAIARQTSKPVYFIGVGEGLDDLKPFEPDEFVDALLSNEHAFDGDAFDG